MAISVSAGSGKKFEPAPGGVHQAVCCDVVDLGILDVTWKGETKKQRKVRLVWQIEELMDDGKPYIVQKRYTGSLHEKSTLRSELESWRGKKFTDQELADFDLEKLINANCLLNIQQVQKDGETWANVTAIMPLKSGMAKIAIRDYVRMKDRTDAKPQPVTDDDIPF